mgnify:CR=1 FL=1
MTAPTAPFERRQLLADERGTLYKEAELRVALVYPSPYRAAMSSLGYQQIYRTLHAMPGVAADRAMLPDAGSHERGLVTLETGQPVGSRTLSRKLKLIWSLEIDPLHKGGLWGGTLSLAGNATAESLVSASSQAATTSSRSRKCWRR